MKRYIRIAMLVLLLVVLTGCSCQHEWREATCTNPKRCRICAEQQGTASGHSFEAATCDAPKTCKACGKTEGEALEHDWVDASCAQAEHCTRCGQTKGQPLDHTWRDATCTESKYCTQCGQVAEAAHGHSWLEATCDTPRTCSICAVKEDKMPGHNWSKGSCTEPKTCLRCGLQGDPATGHSWLEATCTEPVRCEYCDAFQGEALGHDWQAATTESPKTCLTCGEEDGLPIELDDRFIPEDCEMLFGSWQYTLITPAENVGVAGFDRDMVENITYTFGIYGGLEILTEADPECYKALQIAMVMEAVFDSLAAEQGLEGAAAEDYWSKTTRETILEYATKSVERSDWQSYMNYTDEYVYYRSEDALFISTHWEDLFTEYQFSLEGDRLTVTKVLTGEAFELTQVPG